MTIYIAGPDGKPMAFTNEVEAEAYRHSLLAAEPLLLQCLRKHRRTVIALQEQVERALKQPRGRTAALADIECRLRGLGNVMGDDIQAARDAGRTSNEDNER